MVCAAAAVRAWVGSGQLPDDAVVRAWPACPHLSVWSHFPTLGTSSPAILKEKVGSPRHGSPLTQPRSSSMFYLKTTPTFLLLLGEMPPFL